MARSTRLIKRASIRSSCSRLYGPSALGCRLAAADDVASPLAFMARPPGCDGCGVGGRPGCGAGCALERGRGQAISKRGRSSATPSLRWLAMPCIGVEARLGRWPPRPWPRRALVARRWPLDAGAGNRLARPKSKLVFRATNSNGDIRHFPQAPLLPFCYPIRRDAMEQAGAAARL